ncbi:MAG: response regulator [Candidatus Zixiibacteriota bacterium]|nr:MAG: response regulator [candidate division Zixibacteria bacterium]
MTDNDLENLSRKAREKGQPFKILIVDDEPWVRDVFRDFCELTDAFEVDMASSGTEAVGLVSKTTYDLVTMDLVMPEMSGLDALDRIKELSPRTPIVVITGNATEKLVNQAGVLGACKVVYKPIKLDEFIGALNATLLG